MLPLVCSRFYDIYQSMSSLPWVTQPTIPIKKTDWLSFPESHKLQTDSPLRVGLIGLSLTHFEIVSGLLLRRYCRGNHRCRGLMTATAMPCPGAIVSQQFSPNSTSYNISAPPFHDILQTCMEGCDTYRWALHEHQFSVLWQIRSFWINHHPLQKKLLCWELKATLIWRY